MIARIQPTGAVEPATRAYLGRALTVAFVFDSRAARSCALAYVPAVPDGFRRVPGIRRLELSASAAVRDECVTIPERLGLHQWPAIPVRLRGPLGLVWWSRRIPVELELSVAPDLAGEPARDAAGATRGAALSPETGAGAEIKQLRDYRPGDPLHRIDWKATARRGDLVTREFIEDQHLDIVLAIDVGRGSRLQAGNLTRLGLFANVAARFAQHAAAQDDRVGLLTFADRPQAVLPPGRGLTAVLSIRAALEKTLSQAAESSPLAAALRARDLVRHRSLVVLFTDPGESVPVEELTRAVRLLQARHFTIVATVANEEVDSLVGARDGTWLAPYVSLAARERQSALRGRVSALRKLGASVVLAPPERLEAAVVNEYRRLRKERRI